MLTRTLFRFGSTHRVQDFASLNTLLAHLDSTRPSAHCIMFTNQNTQVSQQANQVYEDISNKFMGYHFFRINTNTCTRSPRYFGVKCEPQVKIYALGSPMLDHIGASYENLQNKLKVVQERLHGLKCVDKANIWEGPQDKWRYNYEQNQQLFAWDSR